MALRWYDSGCLVRPWCGGEMGRATNHLNVARPTVVKKLCLLRRLDDGAYNIPEAAPATLNIFKHFIVVLLLMVLSRLRGQPRYT